MSTGRAAHVSALLPDGTVLVAGGKGKKTTAEIYDPVANQWASTGDLIEPRSEVVAVGLPDGRVLVAGGRNLSTSEIYDLDTGVWTAGPEMADSRHRYAAAALDDGSVLFVGGETAEGSSANSEVFSTQ